MLIPRVINGLEKSMTFSLSDVMVKPATARSAFCRVDKDGRVDGSGGREEKVEVAEERKPTSVR